MFFCFVLGVLLVTAAVFACLRVGILVVTDSLGSSGTPANADTGEFLLPGSGREAFTPPLLPGQVYRVTIWGTFTYGEWGYETLADAVFAVDDRRNFTLGGHPNPAIDGHLKTGQRRKHSGH
jgi:hypothetical protein